MVLGRFFLEAPQKFRWTSTRSESVLPVLPISHMGLLVNSFDFLKHHRFLKFKMGFQPALKVRCGDFGRSQLHQIMTRRATGLCGHRQWTALQHNPLRLSRLRKWGRALGGISWDLVGSRRRFYSFCWDRSWEDFWRVSPENGGTPACSRGSGIPGWVRIHRATLRWLLRLAGDGHFNFKRIRRLEFKPFIFLGEKRNLKDKARWKGAFLLL